MGSGGSGGDAVSCGVKRRITCAKLGDVAAAFRVVTDFGANNDPKAEKSGAFSGQRDSISMLNDWMEGRDF